jgi:tetratricopeptide (TPR) repeat protein
MFQMTNNAFRGLGETEERCHAAAALGQVLIGLGQTREARDVLDEAIGLCGGDDLAWCQWVLLEIKSLACRADQDLDAAIRCLEQAFLLRQWERAISASCLRSIADLYLEAGRRWEGAEMYRMAITHAR